MVRTPFTPFALRPFFHFLFITACAAAFAGMYFMGRPIRWTYWAGGSFLGALGGFLQIWSVEEVIHSRRGSPSWKEFLELVAKTRWGKGYLAYFTAYIVLVLFLRTGPPGSQLENGIADYLAFLAAKEAVTLGERAKLERAFSFKERRFEWAKLPRYREPRWRRFLRRWFGAH